MTTKGTHHHKTNGSGSKRAHVGAAANLLLKESKKFANEIYADGIHKVNKKVNEAEENFLEYSDAILEKVRENPFSSLLIAGGIGFLLSLIIKK